MNITLRVWRQESPRADGKMAVYRVNDISEHMSFLEMLDVLNERLTLRGEDPLPSTATAVKASAALCGVVINRVAHDRANDDMPATHALALDGDVVDVEPWRADPFPVIKDLVVDRSAFDRSSRPAAHSAPTGTAPDAPSTPVPNGMPTVPSMPRSASAVAPACHLPQRLGHAVHRREDRPSRSSSARSPERFFRAVGVDHSA